MYDDSKKKNPNTSLIYKGFEQITQIILVETPIFKVSPANVLCSTASSRFDSVLHCKHSVQVLKGQFMVPLSCTSVHREEREGKYFE